MVAHTLSTEGRVDEKHLKLEYMETELKYLNLKPKTTVLKQSIVQILTQNEKNKFRPFVLKKKFLSKPTK